MQEKYQSLRYQYGSSVPLIKYLLIAILCGLLVLMVVPGQYLEKLIARPGSTLAAPSPIQFLALSAGRGGGGGHTGVFIVTRGASHRGTVGSCGRGRRYERTCVGERTE